MTFGVGNWLALVTINCISYLPEDGADVLSSNGDIIGKLLYEHNLLVSYFH